MQIKHVEIGNFRKLQAVRIDFSDETTVFVGANNSGKTSAMTALQKFLVKPKSFSIHDFTLSHWAKMEQEAAKWEADLAANEKLEDFDWNKFLPHLDVWLTVKKTELHRVLKLLPTLDWNEEPIGVRLCFGLKDANAREAFRQEFLKARIAVTNIMAPVPPASASNETPVPPASASNETPVPPASAPNETPVPPASAPSETPAPIGNSEAKKLFSLWPASLMEFLDRRLHTVFAVHAYLLDPAKLSEPENGLAQPQPLPQDSVPLEGDLFKGIIRINHINAQRGFGDIDSGNTSSDHEQGVESQDTNAGKKLSVELRAYYEKHLDPYAKPEVKDIEALRALHDASAIFGDRLQKLFSAPLDELAFIGYPGVTDPKVTINTKMQPVHGLSHPSAVQYEVPTSQIDGAIRHYLPEDSNGLGYQNLVYMIFRLMRYRDGWRQVGKAALSLAEKGDLAPLLHLVLIEEPEAHLHAQVQQVFIKQAYAVLRKHPDLGEDKTHMTQMIVSTHSSHVAHEVDFAALRYFRRLPASNEPGAVPMASVVNMSTVFGKASDTDAFVKRYLKATHCDLFFADGAILIEGPAERILIPHLVRELKASEYLSVQERKAYEYLSRCYITWLEIGGSHAHRLRPLLELLGLNTLIITDIDAMAGDSEKSEPPKRIANQRARNETLKTWVPADDSLDSLLVKEEDDKVINGDNGYAIRVAYQCPIKLNFKSDPVGEALANTFEDALLFENLEFFAKLEGNGLIKKFYTFLNDGPDRATDLNDLTVKVHAALKGAKKAEFALDLLYHDEISQLKMPQYIHEGLMWLSAQLTRKDEDVVGNKTGAT
jgi:predicted ATP-dependent endonuclease of OLD family